MTQMVLSKDNIPIRLTPERWVHITEEHCELAGMREEILETVSNPARVLEGRYGERLAVRTISDGKFLVVIYRQTGDNGFIITAFLTRRVSYLNKRRQLWPT